MLRLKQLFIAVIVIGIGISTSTTLLAATAVEQLLQEYQSQGAAQFSAEQGKAFWNKKFSVAGDTQQRSCTACHTADVRQNGKHVTTGKEIKPLAPSVMSKRFTNTNKIRKWFRRNCHWTVGRECSAQEKGDILMYIKDQ